MKKLKDNKELIDFGMSSTYITRDPNKLWNDFERVRKGKKMTLWQRIKLFFGYCPIHNTKLLHWSSGVWKCQTGSETFLRIQSYLVQKTNDQTR